MFNDFGTRLNLIKNKGKLGVHDAQKYKPDWNRLLDCYLHHKIKHKAKNRSQIRRFKYIFYKNSRAKVLTNL
jgi:hypothetical protein